MKAKLLKKVKKRYVILQVDKLASNASDVLRGFAKSRGLPIFVLIDRYADEYTRDKPMPDRNSAIEYIQNTVYNKYKEKFKHEDAIVKQIWP